jgi:hypothetical protein
MYGILYISVGRLSSVDDASSTASGGTVRSGRANRGGLHPRRWLC